ncbi:hypothetical protein KHM83_15445 [Fusibacter paucivorans]|uniref:Uncharacterized protein n=1 Tax=Fusibacter paucivorans TaxID=76009 RepID=A0ABS5PSD0_9FIRM|nr:hypothetical protein [Fusibacter paucivorans]MBS7528080.1 hypothetical protein [Fusibacter paucivorans]
MKSKQFIRMISALIVSISFFLPWIKSDPNFDTFAASKTGYSGMTILSGGINSGVAMVSAFGKAYGFPLPAETLYIGYLLLLLPILGIAGIVLTGLRKRGGIACIRIQSLMTLIFTFIISFVIFIFPDMKMLLGDMFNISFGLVLMNVFAVIALIFSFETKH